MEDTQNLQYYHFIDLLSELILKHHLQSEKEDNKKVTPESDDSKAKINKIGGQ